MNKGQCKILVTGATGFIGSNLVKKLYSGKNKIIIFAGNTYHPFLKGLKIKRTQGDVRDYESVLKAVKGSDYVYHLAACSLNTIRDKEEIFGVNVLGTENVMSACLESNVKKVVHVSSCSALGFSKNQKKKLDENDYLDFKDQLYGQSKKLGEDKVKEFVAKGLNATIVLPSYVIGAGEIDPARFGLFKSLARGRIKFAYPGGGGTVAVEDLVQGLILAMKKGRAGERYILSNENASFFDRCNLIAGILKKSKIRIKLPRITYYPMYLLGVILPIVVKNPPITTETIRWSYNFRYYDLSKAKRELGWQPKISLVESFENAIKYYKKIGVLEQDI